MPNPSSSPAPLPPPAPAASRRRRRRLLSSSNPSSTTPTSTSGASASSSTSSSSASSNLSFSFPSFSPAASPFHHRFLSPLRASAVPFSWEHRPGIPKTPARQQPRGKPAKPPPLPLPPSLLSNKVVADPFTAAGADYFIIPENDTKTRRRSRRQQRRRPALAATLTDWIAVLSIYRSCTRSHDYLDNTGPPPRPRSPAKAG